MFVSLTILIVFYLFIHAQTDQIVHFKYVTFSEINFDEVWNETKK